jgi:hypothetical protein
MKASLGAEAGITATAHKIARIFYALVKQQLEYDDAIWNRNDEARQRRRKESIKRKAHQLGYRLVPPEAAS